MLICFVATNLEVNYFLIFFMFFIISLIYQMKIYSKNNSEACLKAFKLNNYSGFLIFLLLFTISF